MKSMIISRVLLIVTLVAAPAFANLPPPIRPVITSGSPSPAPTPTPFMYSVLEFVVTTGSDDLRGDSGASASMYAPKLHGSPMICILKSKNADSWDNNSIHTVPCTLAWPTSLADLRNTRITIAILEADPVSGGFGTTDDNWNVQRVRISAYRPGSGKPEICLFDVSGNPLARLKRSEPSVDVTNFPSHC
jgi:hypothetical protein